MAANALREMHRQVQGVVEVRPTDAHGLPGWPLPSQGKT